jgi:fructose-specific phosphotransferase system component IIB
MSNYHPILMKVGTQFKKTMLSSKITEAEVYEHFQDGHRFYLAKSSACYEIGNYRKISMKIGTRTKTDMLSSNITEAEVYVKNAANKIFVKSDIVLNRQRCISAKLYKAKILSLLAEASKLIQQVVKQSYFESHLLR